MVILKRFGLCPQSVIKLLKNLKTYLRMLSEKVLTTQFGLSNSLKKKTILDLKS